ncbi:MAG: serine/threonine-protein phosphatase [Acidobacteriaceae bacterium]|nr:serine/threonine-protein phosphatase [Acidobacteriaceae bacterium]MBV9780821.1 serine/threonine-protein phosphatase [Acidobacteriaceae bacterium]
MASGWEKNAAYWRQLSRPSWARFLAAVFCLFASFSFIFGTVSFGHPDLTPNVCFAVVNGFCAMLWAVTGSRRMIKTMVLVGPAQFAVNFWLSLVFSKGAGIPALQFAKFEHYAIFNVITAIVLIVAAYSLFMNFFSKEGGRYYGTLTEMRLAGEIHRSLVPEIRSTAASYEFYGHSWPSGEVSGDLVDVVQHDCGWFAYVADVSGHGVPAGVLMTMVKSAARTRLAAIGPRGFLSALNDVLLPLSAPNMYVTLAFLSYTAEKLELATAGHVPILYYEHLSGRVNERFVSNFPVAMKSGVPFETSEIASEPGDVFVILTDGLTEVADRQDRDLGLEPLKGVLAANAGAPLCELADRLRGRALQHGKQTDDQTLLLVRRSSL